MLEPSTTAPPAPSHDRPARSPLCRQLDLASEELRVAADELGRITGAIDVEELLDVIFRDFCIGK